MALGKILKLGGMENSPPKTDQSLGRFRVARNVMPTPQNTLIPRYDITEPTGQPSNIVGIHHLADYDGEPLSYVTYSPFASAYETRVYYKNNRIPENSFMPNSPYSVGGADYTQACQSYRINNTSYIFSPFFGNLIKYDGVEISPAGCRQPVISTSSYLSNAARFIRVVQHVMDFDNNEPVSEYVQFPAATTSTTPSNINITVQVTNASPLLLPGGTFVQLPSNLTNVIPTSRYDDWLKENNYFIGTSTYNSVDLHFEISLTSTNILTDSRIGSYVFVSADQDSMLAMGFSNQERGLALKVKSLPAAPLNKLILDSKDAYVLSSGRTWLKFDLNSSQCNNISPQITYGTRNFLTFWESTSATGIYYYRKMVPCFPDNNDASLTTAPARITVTTTGSNIATSGSDKLMFIVAPSLNAWYDTISKKFSPNSLYLYEYANNPDYMPFFSITKYQSMFLFCDDQYIWFSDTSLGGWIEQLEARNSLLIGDKEFGRITSICGTADFLFVGRERKNYYVTGNIATGNYRVQEISDIEVGPWCNNSSINIKDSVIFLTVTGVYQLVSGGKVINLSDKCNKNFESYDSNSVNEDIVFKMQGTCSNIGYNTVETPWSVKGVSTSYDPYRQFLVFMKREDGNPCLVIHTGSGEIYEWNGMFSSYPEMYANCIRFIRGSYYLGELDENLTLKRAKYCVEDKASIPIYPSEYPIKLYTSWMTGGEPSLEKELLQLKMFGRIDTTSTAGIKVRHYKDWNINTLVTDTTYFPVNTSLDLNNQVQFSHKKRLNSDKCLSASVGIEVTQADVTFELESFEVEFNSIQTGMKR